MNSRLNKQRFTLMLFVLGLATSASASDVAPVNNQQYADECGSCHFAYQPGFLPARSWEKIMSNLHDHFGENAELPADTVASLTKYATENAADHSNYKRSKRFNDSIKKDETPLRISEVAYFKREHRELSAKHVKDNPKVKSFSRCDACHTTAAQGSYEERGIEVPGFGKWD